MHTSDYAYMFFVGGMTSGGSVEDNSKYSTRVDIYNSSLTRTGTANLSRWAEQPVAGRVGDYCVVWGGEHYHTYDYNQWNIDYWSYN